MSALQEDCKKGQKWVSCTLVVFQSAYMADIQCRLIIRRQVSILDYCIMSDLQLVK